MINTVLATTAKEHRKPGGPWGVWIWAEDEPPQTLDHPGWLYLQGFESGFDAWAFLVANGLPCPLKDLPARCRKFSNGPRPPRKPPKRKKKTKRVRRQVKPETVPKTPPRPEWRQLPLLSEDNTA